MAELHDDIGHGRNTYPPSKGVPGLPEFEFNSAVGQETKRLLSGKLSTYEAQPFNGNDVPLGTRTNLYNARWRKDKTAIGISSHANAGTKDARGIGVFYWHSSPEAKKLAEIIIDEYKKEFPDRNKYPIWGNGLFPSVPGTWTDLHMCRETAGVFVLVEWEFMTNAESLKLLKSADYRKRCARVKAKSACRWYGIKFDEQPESQPTTQVKGPTKRVNVVTGALGPEYVKQLTEFIRSKNWTAEIDFTKDKNPVATIGWFTTGTSGLAQLEKWLKDRKWNYHLVDYK